MAGLANLICSQLDTTTLWPYTLPLGQGTMVPTIKIDLSRPFHPAAWELLGAFMPGLFFESSLLLARPESVRGIVSRVGLDRYVMLLIALFLAFVVGNAFLAWVRLIQIALWKVHVWIFMWRPKLLDRLVMHSSGTQAQALRGLKPGELPPPPSWYRRLLIGAQTWQVNLGEDQRHAQRAWGKVAAILLKRYGIDDPGDDWTPWTGAVGALRTEDLRGPFLVMSLHAVGWSGLAAIYVAPELKMLPYMGLCLFLVGFGLLNDNSIASRVTHPVDSWLIGVRRAIGELKKVTTAKSEGRLGGRDASRSAADPSDDLP